MEISLFHKTLEEIQSACPQGSVTFLVIETAQSEVISGGFSGFPSIAGVESITLVPIDRGSDNRNILISDIVSMRGHS